MEEKPINLPAAIFVFFTVTISLIAFSLKQKGPFVKSAEKTATAIGLPAPDFTLPGLDGKMISMSDYRGEVVLINIWATWCPPCVDEMPSMEKLYQEFKGEEFEILAVSIDTLESRAVVPFMKKHRLTFPALLDPEGTIKISYKTTGVPESFIIDKEGILIKKIIGPLDWATPDVFRFFHYLVQKPLPGKVKEINTRG